MSSIVNLPIELVDHAKLQAAIEGRSIEEQIEYWARLGKAVEDNPDLPTQFIKDCLQGLTEANAGQLNSYKLSS